MNKPLISLLLAGSVLSGVCAPAEAFLFWNSAPSKDKKEAVSAAVPAPSQPLLTLKEAYRLALEQSEDIAISENVIQEARGQFYQALDIVMPKAHFVITQQNQDAPEAVESSDRVSSSFQRASTPEKKFVFSQPIFSGFKEFAALRGSGALREQRRLELERAKQVLFIDVTEAYCNLLLARRNMDILNETLKTLRDRMKEIDERVKLGRSRESEIQTTIADIKVAEAKLADAARFEVLSKQLLEFYLGRPLTEPLEDTGLDLMDAGELSDYLPKAGTRPDVRAAEEAFSLKQAQVTSAQSGLFPKLSLDGNYYTQRIGFQSGNDWDVTLKADVPIFEGTQVIGDIKVAAAQRDQAEETFLKAKRRAELEIKNNFEEYRSSRAQTEAYLAAQEALKKNYEMQSGDYKLSLISNLDVLDSLERYVQIQADYQRLRYQTTRDYWKLKVAVGEIQ